MAIYDNGTASLAANGQVTGVGTQWTMPLTLIRAGATLVFKTEPVQIYTISEITSDTSLAVYNPNGETVPAGTGYAILAHDGISVQGLAQDVAETLRYYQSRETEVADAVDAFNNFDSADFESKVSQVNTQHGDVVTIGSQVASDAAQVSLDKDSALAASAEAQNSASIAETAAESVSGALVGNFDDGVTLKSKNQVIIQFIDGYARQFLWSGSFPKVVPAGSTPESSGGIGPGAWVSAGDTSLRGELNTAGDPIVDPSRVRAFPVGNLAQQMQFVTPEQYGAIGDGKLHPLSERYSSLAAAQTVYPFVTALTQSIDWAACQKADNLNRGVNPIHVHFYKSYHLGDNYLELGINSKWIGAVAPRTDLVTATFIREGNTGTFGQNCIVRVMNASAAGSPDEFVRGVVFKGFKLTRNRARRYNSKYEGSIGFHANHAMGCRVGVTVNGCEYGVLGYCPWGLAGEIRIDSCHKGIYLDPATATPEYTPAAGAAITSLDLRVEVDASPFGLVLRRCKYSKISGWVEGISIDPSRYPIYDNVNETAIAVSTYNCDSVDITQLGIEFWQGAHFYNYGGTVSANVSWTQDYYLTNTTGKHGPYHAMSVLMSNTELYTLPETANSQHYNFGAAALTIRNMTGDWHDTTKFDTQYFLTTDATSKTVFENCSVYFGSNAARFAPGWLGNVETVGGRYIEDAITPNGYKKIGPNYFVKSSWGTKIISGGDGRVQIAVGSDIPGKLKIHNVDAFAIATETTQHIGLSHVSANDTAVVFQSSATTSGYSINWKATVSWSA